MPVSLRKKRLEGSKLPLGIAPKLLLNKCSLARLSIAKLNSWFNPQNSLKGFDKAKAKDCLRLENLKLANINPQEITKSKITKSQVLASAAEFLLILAIAGFLIVFCSCAQRIRGIGSDNLSYELSEASEKVISERLKSDDLSLFSFSQGPLSHRYALKSAWSGPVGALLTSLASNFGYALVIEDVNSFSLPVKVRPTESNLKFYELIKELNLQLKPYQRSIGADPLNGRLILRSFGDRL
jgi:hypothetical protein